MKKILIYSTAAVILGLLLTLIPLVVIETEKSNSRSMLYCTEAENLKGAYSLGTPKYSAADFEILAISFIAALVAYVLLKWRMPH